MENRVGLCPHCGRAVLITTKISNITGAESDAFYHICKTTKYNQDNMGLNELLNIKSVKQYNAERDAARRVKHSPTPVQLIDINIF